MTIDESQKMILAEWNFQAKEDCKFPVLPDGCRDIIVAQENGYASWFIADLAEATYQASIKSGTSMRGLRFRPGIKFHQARLEKFMQTRDTNELFHADNMLEFIHTEDGILEILDELASEAYSLQQHARRLGISLRTLQRTVKSATGHSPLFWIHLARARKAARALVGKDDLATIAADHSYADQAHMTRDIKRWMGLSPLKFRNDPLRMQAILESGYA